MTIQITLIGLGEIGTSVGLALRYQKNDLRRIGADAKKSAEEAARKNDAVDTVQHNLPLAVKDADIIVLALPGDELESVLDTIASEMKPDAAILDFSLGKRNANRLARKYLKNPANFIGIHAAVNHDVLHEPGAGWRSAREDLFKTGTLFIAPDANTAGDVVELAKDFATLLGANSAYIDIDELDGISARSELAPRVLSTALALASFRTSGWREQRKVGGKPFAWMSALTGSTEQQDGDSVAHDILANRDNVLQAVNETALLLKELRDAIADGNGERLAALFDEAQASRDKWLDEYEKAVWRKEADVRAEQPSLGERMSQFFLGGLARKKKN